MRCGRRPGGAPTSWRRSSIPRPACRTRASTSGSSRTASMRTRRRPSSAGLRASARAGERHGDARGGGAMACDGTRDRRRDRHRALETRGSAATPVRRRRLEGGGRRGARARLRADAAVPQPAHRRRRAARRDARLLAARARVAVRRTRSPVRRGSGGPWTPSAAGLADPAGGLRRQAGDTYAGGHEWPLATLWLGLARRMLGEEPALREAAAQVASRRTSLDLLPEQERPGRPARMGAPARVDPRDAAARGAPRAAARRPAPRGPWNAGDGRGG